ncbi:MAG: CoA transferase, partial [Chloroflexi bacterium]|nr:CoA transferase [Chloroflexota bacterium]
MLPLDNVKVLDLTALAPGPFCSMVLGDLGADVLLIEPPQAIRPAGPPNPNPQPARDNALDNLRRNKRSLVLNLKEQAAREVFYKLAKDADVVMEGFRPGVTKRMGVDYETLRGINKRIVYCSISGYGQDGPYRDLPGHDVNYISFAGVLGLIGSRDGQPSIPYNLIADFAGGGYLSALTILTALWARQRTGEGQYLDMSLMDGSMYLLADSVGRYYQTGEVPKRGQVRLNGGFPDYQAYRCKDDKYLTIGSLEYKFWVNTCKAVGREDLIETRQTQPEEGLAALRKIFATKTRDEWFDILSKQDICVGKVNTLDELERDPQVQARNMRVELKGPDGLRVHEVGIAAHLRGTPGAIRTPGHSPGADTVAVLKSLGYTQVQIDTMLKSGT